MCKSYPFAYLYGGSGVAIRELLAHASEVAHAQLRLREFLDVEFAVLFYIEPVELRFHETHPLMLGDFAGFAGINQEQRGPALKRVIASRNSFRSAEALLPRINAVAPTEKQSRRKASLLV